MSHSEDEDDFLSADEDVGSDDERQADDTKKRKHVVGSKEAGNTKGINKSETSIEASDNTFKDGKTKEIDSTHEKGSKAEADHRREQREPVCRTRSLRRGKEEACRTQGEEEDEDEEDDDEEEALAERIRERNLKIARNFSLEIAKNLQASAPIPVNTSNSSSRFETSEDPDNILDVSQSNSANPPPAPPPTPALSSSYNNLSEPTNQNSSGPSLSLGSQYSWRIPPKATSTTTAVTTNPTVSNAQTSCNSTSSTSSSTNADSAEQARLALDRLSQKLSKPNKNLFDRVTDDIRNMSIKGDDSKIVSEVASQISATLPTTITDIGSTIGSWGWSGATSLLSSATQVTSQVGSVLNSVSQQLQPTYQLQEEDNMVGKKNAKDE